MLANLQLDLTVAAGPPTEGSAPAPPAPRPPRETTPAPPGPEPLPEAELGMLVETAVLQIVEAGRTVTAEALAEISAHLEQGRTEAEAFLERTREESASVVRLMEEVLDNSADVAVRTEKKYEEAHQTSLARLEQLHQRAEQLLTRVLAQAEEQSKRSAARADTLVAEAQALAKHAGWKPWAMAGGVCLGVILMLTLLRPGWTMSPGQRTALRVGEAVIYTYAAASPAERAEMRRVNRWREPGRPDSTAAPEPARR